MPDTVDERAEDAAVARWPAEDRPSYAVRPSRQRARMLLPLLVVASALVLAAAAVAVLMLVRG